MALIKSSQVFRYFWCSGRIYILYNNLSFISQHFEKATTSKCKTRHVYKMVFSPLLLWLLCPFEKWEFIPLAHNSWGSGRRPDDQTRRFQNLALEVERTPLRQHWSCSKGRQQQQFGKRVREGWRLCDGSVGMYTHLYTFFHGATPQLLLLPPPLTSDVPVRDALFLPLGVVDGGRSPRSWGRLVEC